MTNDQFNAIFDQVVEKCRAIHATKGAQYANGGDRLGNFKRAAERKGVQPETILSIYMDKHLDTMNFVQRKIEETGSVPRLHDPLIETVCDVVNYAILQLGLAVDREMARTSGDRTSVAEITGVKVMP